MAAGFEHVFGIWVLVPKKLELLVLAATAPQPLDQSSKSTRHAANEALRFGGNQLRKIGERHAVVSREIKKVLRIFR